jgi:hypothetical protein
MLFGNTTGGVIGSIERDECWTLGDRGWNLSRIRLKSYES